MLRSHDIWKGSCSEQSFGWELLKVPKEESIMNNVPLPETNISPKNGNSEDDFPLPKVGYVSSQEWISNSLTQALTLVGNHENNPKHNDWFTTLPNFSWRRDAHDHDAQVREEAQHTKDSHHTNQPGIVNNGVLAVTSVTLPNGLGVWRCLDPNKSWKMGWRKPMTSSLV